jgi:hypothetical protein
MRVTYETEQGWRLYKGITDVVILTECHRFEEPNLELLLNTIRADTQEQRRIPDHLWELVQRQYVGHCDYIGENGADTRLNDPEFQDGLFLATSWQVVAREQHARITRDGSRTGELVQYVQAIDTQKHALTKEEHTRLQTHPNMTSTGRMMSLFGGFCGQRVRLTQKISKQPLLGLVPDTPGTIVGFEYHENEMTPWLDNPQHPAWERGWVLLEYMPVATLVRFDHLAEKDLIILPDQPPGVVAVQAMQVDTDVLAIGRPKKVSCTRIQMPLAPLDTRTIHGAQGYSKSHVLGCFLGLADITTDADNESERALTWALMYVMLSRCTRLENLLLLYPPPNLRNILESGPPHHVLKEMERLRGLATGTLPKITEARARLHWPPRK